MALVEPLAGLVESTTPDSIYLGSSFYNGGHSMSADGLYAGAQSGFSTFQPYYSVGDGFSNVGWKNGTSKSVSGYDTQCYGIAMSQDGTAFITPGGQNHVLVFCYNLTPQNWNTGNTITSSIVSQIGLAPGGVAASQDGTHIYIGYQALKTIYQYGATNCWAGNAGFAYASKSLDVSAKVTTDIKQMSLSTDGTEIYIAELGKVHQYHMSTAWDISTGSWVRTLTFNAAYATGSMANNSTMTVLDSNDIVGVHYFATAKDISSADTGARVGTQASPGTAAVRFWLDPSETHLSLVYNNGIYQYLLDAAGEVGEGHLTYQGLYTPAQGTAAKTIVWKPDGTKFWIGNSNNYMYGYTVSPAWDITNVTYDGTSHNMNESVDCLWVSTDGSTVFHQNSSTRYVRSKPVGTPWDVTTIGTNTDGGYFTNLKCLSFTSDGLHLITVDPTYGVTDWSEEVSAWSVKTSDLMQRNWLGPNPWNAAVGSCDWTQISPDGAYLYVMRQGAFTKVPLPVFGGAAGGAGWGMLPVGS